MELFVGYLIEMLRNGFVEFFLQDLFFILTPESNDEGCRLFEIVIPWRLFRE